MVFDEHFLRDAIARPAVDEFAPDLIRSVVFSVVPDEAVILLKYVIRKLRLAARIDRALEMVIGDPKLDLKGKVCRIVEPKVDVVIKYAGTAAERQNAVLVRKRIKAVMMSFSDLKRRVESHPIQQIRQLT